MILPDVNVLLHAVNSDSPKNEGIHTWWDHCLIGVRPVYLTWIVILGFVRISTNPRIFNEPLNVSEAGNYISDWLEQPPVDIIIPREGHWEIVQELLEKAGTAANLTTDAHLAALALQWDCTVYTTDTDFARFEGLKWKRL